DSLAFTITDGVNSATANLVLLAPNRPPVGPLPLHPERIFRGAAMGAVTNLFPPGLTLAGYDAMTAPQQKNIDQSLVASIHQGFVGGDSAAAANMISAI